MLRYMHKSKIHRARVTDANVHYEGSVTIDERLMKAADILINERVQIVSLDTGHRLETYVIPGKAGSGTICMNGAAARCFKPGEKVIIISYALMDNRAAKKLKPKVVRVNGHNRIKQ